MPVDPTWRFVDHVHPSGDKSKGYTYGCLTKVPKDKKHSIMQVQDGWTEDGRKRMITIMSTWGDRCCGHLESRHDNSCNGCFYKGVNDES